MNIREFNKIKSKAQKNNISFTDAYKAKDINWETRSQLEIKYNKTPLSDLNKAQEYGRKFNLEMKVFSNGSKGPDVMYYGTKNDVLKLLSYLDSLNAQAGYNLYREVYHLLRDSIDEEIINGYVVSKSQGKYWVYNNKGHFEEDKYKAQGYPSFEMAKSRAQSLPKGIAIGDVNPRENESKNDFIARFMNETKSEYPDEKQRYAVANSYWERKGKDSINDSMNTYEYTEYNNSGVSYWSNNASDIEQSYKNYKNKWGPDSDPKHIKSYLKRYLKIKNRTINKVVFDGYISDLEKLLPQVKMMEKNEYNDFPKLKVGQIFKGKKGNTLGGRYWKITSIPSDLQNGKIEAKSYDNQNDLQKDIHSGRYNFNRLELEKYIEYPPIKDSIHDSMESEVKQWWSDVEKWNRENGNKFNIDNTGASAEDMLVAMFDMIPDLRGVNNQLYNNGKRIYNKYSKYSQYRDSFKQKAKDFFNVKDSKKRFEFYWHKNYRKIVDKVKDDAFANHIEVFVRKTSNPDIEFIALEGEESKIRNIISKYHFGNMNGKNIITDSIKDDKIYTITWTGHHSDTREKSGTLEELKKYFANRLSWSNKNITNIKQLVKELNLCETKSYNGYDPYDYQVKDSIKDEDNVKDATYQFVVHWKNGKISTEQAKGSNYHEALKSLLKLDKVDWIEDNKGIDDSIYDEDIEELSKEEQQAIEDYKKAISGTTDVKLLELYSHILREEIEHLRELNEAKGMDSVKDSKYVIKKITKKRDGGKPFETYINKIEYKSDINALDKSLNFDTYDKANAKLQEIMRYDESHKDEFEMDYDIIEVRDSVKDKKIKDEIVYAYIDKKQKLDSNIQMASKSNQCECVDLGSEYRISGQRDDVEYTLDMLGLDESYIDD